MSNGMVEHMVESVKRNPLMARGLRNLIKEKLEEHQPGTEAHSHLLETLSSLDAYIAQEGQGYQR